MSGAFVSSSSRPAVRAENSSAVSTSAAEATCSGARLPRCGRRRARPLSESPLAVVVGAQDVGRRVRRRLWIGHGYGTVGTVGGLPRAADVRSAFSSACCGWSARHWTRVDPSCPWRPPRALSVVIPVGDRRTSHSFARMPTREAPTADARARCPPPSVTHDVGGGVRSWPSIRPPTPPRTDTSPPPRPPAGSSPRAPPSVHVCPRPRSPDRSLAPATPP